MTPKEIYDLEKSIKDNIFASIQIGNIYHPEELWEYLDCDYPDFGIKFIRKSDNLTLLCHGSTDCELINPPYTFKNKELAFQIHERLNSLLVYLHSLSVINKQREVANNVKDFFKF